MSNTDLLKELQRLQAENAELKYNPNYGILTRQGLEMEHRKLTGPRIAVMIDIDHLHELNARYGDQEPVNALLRAAFDFRHEDLLISGNWASGDEIAFIIRSDPEGFMFRLAASLASHGLSATMAYEPIIDGDLLTACRRALKSVYSAKNKRAR